MLTATKTQQTIKVYVEAHQYDSNLDELDWETQDLELTVFPNGQPLRPQIEMLVRARLGQNWRVPDGCWRIDEPAEAYEDEF